MLDLNFKFRPWRIVLLVLSLIGYHILLNMGMPKNKIFGFIFMLAGVGTIIESSVKYVRKNIKMQASGLTTYIVGGLMAIGLGIGFYLNLFGTV